MIVNKFYKQNDFTIDTVLIVKTDAVHLFNDSVPSIFNDIISNCLEYAILSVLVRPRPSVTEMTDPSFSNALLYWMFRDQ